MDDHESLQEKFQSLLDTIDPADSGSAIELDKIRNLQELSKIQPPADVRPIPTTVVGKARATAWNIWDNETTRVVIKSGLAAAGVLGVTWATVHRDHVLTRDALSQANQTPR